MSIYRRVFRYYRPFFPQTVVGLLFSLIGIGLNLLRPWPFKIIVDEIIPRFTGPYPLSRNFPFHLFGKTLPLPPFSGTGWIALLCLALVVIQFLWGLINWITNYILVKVGLQALLKLRTDLYAYLQSLSLKYSAWPMIRNQSKRFTTRD